MAGKLAIVLGFFFASVALAAPTVTVADSKIVISGMSSPKGLSVVVAEGTEADIAARPPVSGEWTAEAGKIVFTPKYPLKAGTAYRVIGTPDRIEVRTPKAEPGKRTVIDHIYPSAPELPENVLRFYIEFNQPMPRGDVYKYVQVIADDGKPVEQPFVELDNELWNADQTRLTLLIDPGRIKNEVKPRLDLGPVFRAGKKYTMVVRGKWPTLDGESLGKDLSKPITVVAPVADGIDPKAWKVSPPSDDGAPLRVTFGRTLDRIILMRSLAVLGSDGQPVTGTAEATDGETAWRFALAGRWAAGSYILRVDSLLEDVCGNAVGRPFEVDLSRPRPKEIKASHVDLPFTVGRR